MIELNKKEFTELKKIYCDFHKNPELSFQEIKTSKKLIGFLKELGFDIIDNIGEYGFVGILNNGEGPTIMLRTDMDALPIKELTNIDYKSEVEATDWFGNKVNVMHACGHDLHMTLFIGTLRKLVEHKDKWNGTLIALGQPAEELGKGAKAMVADGLFDKIPIPEYLLAFHDSPDLEPGQIGFTKGVSWAGCDSLDLTVFGEGGHGAIPEKAKDPIVIASQIILALQTISSREFSAFTPIVLTVGAISGGTKHNIIPDKVELKISLRTFDSGVRDKVVESIRRIANNIACAAGIKKDKLPVLTGIENYHPPVYNDIDLVDKYVHHATKIIGKENVIEMKPVSVSEDFEIFHLAEPKIKAALIWLGVDNLKEVELPEELQNRTPPLHSPYLAPDIELPIYTGVKVMTNSVIDLFNN